MKVEGKHIGIIGAKRSGIAAALMLQKQGAAVFVSDNEPLGKKERRLLEERKIRFEEGKHTNSVLEADFCIVSPGISSQAPIIRCLENEKIAMFSEIEAASWFCPARIIGITGTDGKTTTANLVAAMCRLDVAARGRKVFSVGNIGLPFSSCVLTMKEGDIAVVELSSYQLERCASFRPDVAVITNLMPDHLDRYGGSMDRYAEAKYRIYARQRAEDTLVYNYDNERLRSHFADGGAFTPRLFPFSKEKAGVGASGSMYAAMDRKWLVTGSKESEEKVIGEDEIFKRSFRGTHNLENALAAVAASRAAGAAASSVREALREFSGVEHRQEYVRTLRGADWINDSKATNLNALRQALEATPGTLLLIAGGRDKGEAFAALEDAVRQKVALLVAFGESREKFAAAFGSFVKVIQVATLEEAVRQALQYASAVNAVLFSPGCSSFDLFENFEARGRMFKKQIQEIQE